MDGLAYSAILLSTFLVLNGGMSVISSVLYIDVFLMAPLMNRNV